MSLLVHKHAAAKRRIRGPRRNGPVVTVRVNPLVMAAAVDLAGGDPSRIRVIDARSVLVENQARRRQANH